MKIVLILFATVFSLTPLFGQNKQYIGQYSDVAESDYFCGNKLDETFRFEVKLTLKADSTYKVEWFFDDNSCCSFDTTWYNTGKWLSKKDILYFTSDTDTIADTFYYKKGDDPIYLMSQYRFDIITKKDEKQIAKFRRQQAHDFYSYYLKIEDDAIRFDPQYNCINKIWGDNVIQKVK